MVGMARYGGRAERLEREPSTQFLLGRRHDPVAREALLSRVMPLTRRIASRYRPPRAADFDDLVQVGLIAATDAITAWDPGGAAFTKHVAVTIHYRIIDYVRMRGHRSERGLDNAVSDRSPSGEELLALLPDNQPGPEEVVLAREKISLIVALIRRLPPRKRTALLGMMSNKTPREIDPGASENAIYSSASRARSRLKPAIAKL